MPSSTISAPLHLNSTGCVIRHTQDKGRGVYASRPIPSQSLIEISPALLFSKEEYTKHGQFTILDEYTFKWPDGRMALALGLGSLFNHSEHPNVSWTLDTSTESIRYTAVRNIASDEELCIFYGHKLWFQPSDCLPRPSHPKSVSASCQDDACDGLSSILHEEPESSLSCPRDDGPCLNGDPNEIIAEEHIPWRRYKLPPEEEDIDSIRTVEAWAVDISDPRHIAAMLKWLKQAFLDTPDLSHLKRIRKLDGKATLLLATLITSPSPPSPPSELGLPAPYRVLVPQSSALTSVSLKLKSTFWPTLFTPSRKGDVEEWTYGKVRWACEAMQSTVAAAQEARKRGELPIAAHVAAPYVQEPDEAEPTSTFLTFTASDSRQSNAHPLRHAVLNVIRQVADYRSSGNTLAVSVGGQSLQPGTPSQSSQSEGDSQDEGRLSNGANYLLTSLTVFTTHEPCIMCSMALTHSRVKEVFYIHPMPKTGGCGGVACVSTLQGVNHRFGVFQLKMNAHKDGAISHTRGIYSGLQIDDATDA